jgi:hypothetical protein
MIKKIKELNQKLDKWLEEEFYIDLGLVHVTMNNFTAYIFLPLVFLLIAIGIRLL